MYHMCSQHYISAGRSCAFVFSNGFVLFFILGLSLVRLKMLKMTGLPYMGKGSTILMTHKNIIAVHFAL